MRKAAILAILMLFALLLIGCGSQNNAIMVSGVVYDEAQIVQGQQIYTRYCASCHGASGEGQFPDAPNFPDGTGRIGAPPHNDQGHTWHHTDSFLIEYVRNGGMSLNNPASFYPMPAFGEQLTDEQIGLVLAYIKTFWTPQQRDGQQRASSVG